MRRFHPIADDDSEPVVINFYAGNPTLQFSTSLFLGGMIDDRLNPHSHPTERLDFTKSCRGSALTITFSVPDFYVSFDTPIGKIKCSSIVFVQSIFLMFILPPRNIQLPQGGVILMRQCRRPRTRATLRRCSASSSPPAMKIRIVLPENYS
jgi:hypothetical protein